MGKYFDDVFLILGILLVLVPTFLLNVFVGCYLAGAFCIVLSVLMAVKPEKKT